MGSPRGAPHLFWVFGGLKSDANAELQLAQAHGRTRGGIGLDVRDLAGATAAIHAGVAGDGEDRMVEQVVGIEAELRLNALGDREGLRERHVVVEGVRTSQRIESGVADLAATWKRENTRGWTRKRAGVESRIGGGKWISERGNRRIPERTSSRFRNARLNLTTRVDVWTAWASIFDRAALPDTRSEGKSGAVCESVGDLPATDRQVLKPTSAAQVLFTPAEGQLVDRVGHKHLITIVRVWTPSKLLVDGVIGGVVRISV